MERNGTLVLALFLCWTLLAVPLPAYALRCGNWLVDEGDTKPYVYRACGEPDYQEVTGYRYTGRSKLKIEIWFYDFGPQRFTQTLTFHGNRLVRIEAGEYGIKTYRK
jgi:hypothetical protein